MTEQATTARREGSLPAWNGHLQSVDRALGQSDLDGARRAWENAHLAAVESLSWEGLIATGHACLRVGGATGARPAAEATARRAYFAALYRACRENSFDGILRAAEAFDDLGDREVVEECLGPRGAAGGRRGGPSAPVRAGGPSRRGLGAGGPARRPDGARR